MNTAKTKLSMRKKSQRGLSLIESAMVLALAASVVAGVLFYYNSSKEKYEINEGIKTVQNVAAAVNKLYAGQASMEHKGGDHEFNGKVIEAVAQVAGLKTKQVNGQTVIQTPAGRGLQLWQARGDRSYQIRVETDSVSACVAYATLNLGTLMRKGTQIINPNQSSGNTGVTSPEGNSHGLAPHRASALCKQYFDAKGDKPIQVVYNLGF